MKDLIAGAVVDSALYLAKKPQPMYMGPSSAGEQAEWVTRYAKAWAKEHDLVLSEGDQEWAKKLAKAPGPSMDEAADGEVIGEAGKRIVALIDELNKALK